MFIGTPKLIDILGGVAKYTSLGILQLIILFYLRIVGGQSVNKIGFHSPSIDPLSVFPFTLSSLPLNPASNQRNAVSSPVKRF